MLGFPQQQAIATLHGYLTIELQVLDAEASPFQLAIGIVNLDSKQTVATEISVESDRTVAFELEPGLYRIAAGARCPGQSIGQVADLQIVKVRLIEENKGITAHLLPSPPD